ncbi:early nodulin-like protein 4 [Miscanthus floridulus]|uniref:early nodulin-like protein 4 n=1 Tax=Miscanthus floridulus TaxID=154761 RepID=UPI00345AC6B0
MPPAARTPALTLAHTTHLSHTRRHPPPPPRPTAPRHRRGIAAPPPVPPAPGAARPRRLPPRRVPPPAPPAQVRPAPGLRLPVVSLCPGFCRRSLPRPTAWFHLALMPPHNFELPYFCKVLEASPCRGGAAEI